MRVVILEEWIQILKDLQLRLYGTGQFNIILLSQKNCWNELLKAKLVIVDFLPMSKQLTFCRHTLSIVNIDYVAVTDLTASLDKITTIF